MGDLSVSGFLGGLADPAAPRKVVALETGFRKGRRPVHPSIDPIPACAGMTGSIR
jgi:hypothetical protein